MADLAIKYFSTDDLIPYENNPRRNDESVDGVAASIREFGWKVPIVIDSNNVIVAGHTRWKAANRLGIKRVPCVVADDLTDEQIKGFRLADNKTAELSEWDFGRLEEELKGISMDMSQFGFDDLLEEPTEIVEDEVPEVDEDSEPIVKRGEVWKLGDHRLMCGDATSKEDVDRLMRGGQKADLVFTDPPYGISVVQKEQVGGGGALHFGGKKGAFVPSSTYKPIQNDDTTDTAKENYLICRELSKNQIIFGGNYFTDFLQPSKCWIVWDKQNTGHFADAELAWTSFDKGVRLYEFLWNGLCREGSREVEGKTRVHPTQKPVGLIAEILKDFSEENETILDCFGGSGSTLIACEQLKRKCLMMELDPHYCDVIIKRWETLTEEKAIKV